MENKPRLPSLKEKVCRLFHRGKSSQSSLSIQALWYKKKVSFRCKTGLSLLQKKWLKVFFLLFTIFLFCLIFVWAGTPSFALPSLAGEKEQQTTEASGNEEYSAHASREETAIKQAEESVTGEPFDASLPPVAVAEDFPIEETYNDFFDALPDTVKDRLPEEDAESVSENLGIAHLFALLWESVLDKEDGFRMLLLQLLAWLLLCAMFTYLVGENNFGRGVVRLVFTVALYASLAGVAGRVFAFFADLATLSGATLPAFLALFVAGGNPATAATTSVGFSSFIYSVSFCGSTLLPPLLRAMFALVLVRGISQHTATNELSKSIKNITLSVLVLLSTLFAASFGFQTLISSSADSMTMRSAKYATSQMIPVVGGNLSSSLGALSSVLGVVRSSIGGSSVVALFLLFFPVLVELFLTRTILSLASSMAKTVGIGEASDVLDDFTSVLDLLLAVCALLVALFVVILGVVLQCSFATS